MILGPALAVSTSRSCGGLHSFLLLPSVKYRKFRLRSRSAWYARPPQKRELTVINVHIKLNDDIVNTVQDPASREGVNPNCVWPEGGATSKLYDLFLSVNGPRLVRPWSPCSKTAERGASPLSYTAKPGLARLAFDDSWKPRRAMRAQKD